MNSCNAAILGDLGRFPIQIETKKRFIKYKLRILTFTENIYVKLCYNMILLYDSHGYDIGPHIRGKTYILIVSAMYGKHKKLLLKQTVSYSLTSYFTLKYCLNTHPIQNLEMLRNFFSLSH